MNQFYPLTHSLQIGDRIIVPKSTLDLIQHHAIYLGWNSGHQWIIENKEGVGVKLSTLQDFLAGVNKITRIEKFVPTKHYGRINLVQFAVSQIGQRYHLTNYNCEHFASEVQHRKGESQQIRNAETLTQVAGACLLIMSLLYSIR